jgi:hypothetical protein
MLWGLADHGFRPGKAIGWLIIVLLVFWLIFWFRLGVVGFEPTEKDPASNTAGKAWKEAPKDAEATSAATADGQLHPFPVPEPWPISFLFLFDRLVPIYKIRDEHYSITRYFRKATPSEIAESESRSGRTLYPMMYFGKKYLVWPADDHDKVRVERLLVALRVIGVGLSVFLLAAINALTSH